MNGRIRKSLAIAAISALALAGCASGSGNEAGSAAGAQQLNMYTHVALDHPVNVELQAFADEVKEGTDGRIEFVLRPAGEVPYTQTEGLQVVRDGLMDAALVAGGSVGGDEQIFDVPGLPFLITSEENLDKALPVFHEHIDPILEEKHNFIRLGEYVWPPQALWLTSADVQSFEDAAGSKIRVFNPMFSEATADLGLEPVTMAATEVNSSLQRGVIDGSWTSVSHAVGSNLTDLVDSVIVANGGYIYDVFGISGTVWESISPEDQEVIMAAGESATERLRDVQIGSGEDEFWQAVEDAGVNIVELDDAEIDAIHENLQASYPGWAAERGPEAEALLEELLAVLGTN